jgi:uncharacterized protein (TIGR00369 family)
MTAVNVETANAQFKEVFADHVQALNPSVEAIDREGAILRMPYSDTLCRSGQIICGQALMTLIDTCMVFVCYGGLDEYRDVTTVSQNTTFLRPAIGGDVIATGRLVKPGRTLIFGEVSLAVEGNPKVVCTGTSTYAIIG